MTALKQFLHPVDWADALRIFVEELHLGERAREQARYLSTNVSRMNDLGLLANVPDLLAPQTTTGGMAHSEMFRALQLFGDAAAETRSDDALQHLRRRVWGNCRMLHAELREIGRQ